MASWFNINELNKEKVKSIKEKVKKAESVETKGFVAEEDKSKAMHKEVDDSVTLKP